MRFSFQAGTIAGLDLAAPSLRATGELLLATDDWSTLDLETQAVGLVLGVREDTQCFLEDLASKEPARALSLALRTARYSFRFARSGGAMVRVIEATTSTFAASLPGAEFWRELRRSTLDSTRLQSEVEAVAAEFAPDDLRLRAGLAHVFPDSGRWWIEGDRVVALEVGDPDEGALMLLALMRHDAATLHHTSWPPPGYRLRGLKTEELIAALRWCPSKSGRLAGTTFTDEDILGALRRVPEPSALLLLSRAQPSNELVRRIQKPAGARATQRLVRRVLAHAWKRAPGTLPPLQLLDGSRLEVGLELARLRAALRRGDSAALDDFRRRATPESLANFAEFLLVQWLLDQKPKSGRWALDATGHFPSDDVASALTEFEEVNKRDVTRVLAKMGTRSALTQLAALTRSDEYEFCRVETQQHLEGAARAHGLSASELEDRLVPELSLPPGATARVDEELALVLERDGVALPLPADWKAAVEVLPAALGRLERRMVDGGPMSVVHFTESWAMNPLLFAAAQNLVWGVFRGDHRIALFVPGQPLPMSLDDGLGLRPLHPLELAPEELHAARSSLAAPQPFPQLKRACFDEWSWPGVVLVDDIHAVHLRLTDCGWARDPEDRDIWERDGEGWAARIAFVDEPGFELRYRLTEFLLHGKACPRVVSELQRELFVATEAAVDRPRGGIRETRCGAQIVAAL